MKTFSCLTTLLLTAGLFLSPSLAAEEEIKYLSPDGRFALRITQPKDDEYHPTVELIEKDSGKVIVTLHSASDTELFDASESVLVWSADSTSVAYGFRDSPPGVRVVSLGTLVCFWNGSGFDKVFLPENLPVPDIKFPEGKGGYEKPYGGGVKPLRWLKSGGSGDVQRGRSDVARQNLYRRAAVYDFLRRAASRVREEHRENEDKGVQVNENIIYFG